MRIKLINVRLAGPTQNVGPGEIADVSLDAARLLVQAGHATYVDDIVHAAPPAPRTVTITTVAPAEQAVSRRGRKKV